MNDIDILRAQLARLNAELDETRQKLKQTQNELEGHEGLLRLAMEDMRRLYEDLLSRQADLLQADKLATIGILTAGITHEINNPLASLQACLYLLKEKALPSEAQPLVASAQKTLDRVIGITRDMRVVTRKDTGRTAPEDLNKIWESILPIAAGEIKRCSAELKTEWAALPPVTCNAQQISQVFLNLLVNACQALTEPGVISIRTFPVSGFAATEIADTGAGMPPDVQEKIFQPFFTTKEPGKGTGLGLSISADIVRQHGGKIAVKSEPGRGTAFTVSLPL